MKRLKITTADAGQRLDRLLKRLCPTVPFVGLQKAIRTGAVKVNGKKAPMDFRLREADEVVLALPTGNQQTSASYTPTAAEKAALKQTIVYEDAQLLALNKPQGLPSQAGGGQVKSLDRLLSAVYGPAKTPKLVHRLDKETTGLILCAKNRTTAAALSEQWAGRTVVKGYLALVLAKQLPARGDFKEPIAKQGPQAVVNPQGDVAHTQWVCLGPVAEGVQAVLAFPLTGRMNQIRVHFAHHGFPLVGDDKYGDFQQTKAAGKQFKTGLALHAWRLQITHPSSQQTLELTAPLPAALAALLPESSGLLASANGAWQRWVAQKKG